MTYPLDAPPSTSPSSLRIRTALLQNLTTQTALIQQLFSHFTSPTPSSSTVDPVNTIYALLHSQIVDMAELVKELWEHQEAYNKLISQKREVIALERQVRDVIRTLEKGRADLEEMVHEGKEVRESIDRGKRHPIAVQPLLAHAQRLATHSSAPVSSLLQPIDKAQYMPWPTEAAMRQGLLFAMQGSMSGIGDLGRIGDEAPVAQAVPEIIMEAVPEESGRRYDPHAVYDLDLNSDSDDD